MLEESEDEESDDEEVEDDESESLSSDCGRTGEKPNDTVDASESLSGLSEKAAGRLSASLGAPPASVSRRGLLEEATEVPG